MNKMVVHGFGCHHLNDVQMWVIFYRTQINNAIFAASLLSMVLLYRVFPFVFQKLFLSILIYIMIMVSFFWILLSNIQDGKHQGEQYV